MNSTPATTGQPIPSGLQLSNEQIRLRLEHFIRDETRNAGFGRAVVGVSGGVDSAVSVTLAAGALGEENVLGVLMPYSTSSPASAADAAALLKKIGVRSETVEISPVVDAFLKRDSSTDRVRKGNLMARARMIALFDISARDGAIVIGTSNKTEILLGYGTLYGDTACGINPIGDLYKTQVWELAAHLGVPKAIIEKQPTADLWAGQTDEAELGFSYLSADRLLRYMVDEGRTDEDLLSLGFDQELIRNVKTRMQGSSFKRRPPLIAKISSAPDKTESGTPRKRGVSG